MTNKHIPGKAVTAAVVLHYSSANVMIHWTTCPSKSITQQRSSSSTSRLHATPRRAFAFHFQYFKISPPYFLPALPVGLNSSTDSSRHFNVVSWRRVLLPSCRNELLFAGDLSFTYMTCREGAAAGYSLTNTVPRICDTAANTYIPRSTS